VTTTIDLRFRRIGRGAFLGGVFMTLLIHGALAGLAWYAHFGSPPAPEIERDLMVTRLVSFGKPREKFWLPKIKTPPRPQAPEPTIKVSEDPNAAPAQKAAPRPEDPDTSKDMRRALERARALAKASVEDPAEGSLTGSTAGTSTEASVGDEYATKVYEAIRKNWNVPTGLSLGVASNLVTDVIVSIGDDGALGSPRIKKSSGNDLYDASCMQAVQATGKVPPPPAEARGRYRRGVTLGFEGQDLAR